MWAIFGEALTLYFLGLTGALIVDLHGTVEYYARRDTPYLIAPDGPDQDLVRQLVERRTLAELSPMLVTLGAWATEDNAAIGQLSKLRNGIAHNNETALGRALGGVQFGHILDARIAVEKVNVLPLVIAAIHAMVKLSNFRKNNS